MFVLATGSGRILKGSWGRRAGQWAALFTHLLAGSCLRAIRSSRPANNRPANVKRPESIRPKYRAHPPTGSLSPIEPNRIALSVNYSIIEPGGYRVQTAHQLAPNKLSWRANKASLSRLELTWADSLLPPLLLLLPLYCS